MKNEKLSGLIPSQAYGCVYRSRATKKNFRSLEAFVFECHPFYDSAKNTKEIGHFRPFFYKIFCFGHNFLTDVIFSNPLSQAIYILPVLRRDTHIDHIYGHINPYKNGHYGYFAEIGHYGLT